jgi:voltage-gated potassium channel Kch
VKELRNTLQRLARRVRVRRWFVLAGLAVVMFAIGLWEYLHTDGISDVDAVHRALQLFSFDAEAGAGGALFQVARFTAPVLAAGAALTAFADVLREQIQAAKVERWSGHTVVAGLGDKGIGLIDRLDGKVAALERDRNNQAVQTLRRRGIPVVIGDARDGTTLAAAGIPGAKQLIVVAGDDATTTAVAAAAAGVGRRRGRGPLVVLVHVGDSELAQALSLVDCEEVDYRYFSLEDNAVSALIDAHPLPVVPRRSPVVRVCGAGRLAQRLVVHLGRGRLAAGAGPVTVLHDAGDAALWAELGERVTFLSETVVCKPTRRGATWDLAFVCTDDDAVTATTALALAGERDRPVVAVLRSEHGLADLLLGSDAASGGRPPH